MNNQICSIETLNGNNFVAWKNDIELALGLADLDMALLEDEPAKSDANSVADEKMHYQKWERANRLSIMVIKKSISPSFKASVPNETNAKKFLASIGDRFLEFEKAETGELMQKLNNMQYDGVSGI